MPPVAMYDDVSTASFGVHDDAKENQQSPELSPPPVRKVQRRRSVGFVPDHEVQEFEAEEMPEAIWYTRDEYDIIKVRERKEL